MLIVYCMGTFLPLKAFYRNHRVADGVLGNGMPVKNEFIRKREERKENILTWRGRVNHTTVVSLSIINVGCIGIIMFYMYCIMNKQRLHLPTHPTRINICCQTLSAGLIIIIIRSNCITFL